MLVHYLSMSGGYHHLWTAATEILPKQGGTIAIEKAGNRATRFSEYVVREVILKYGDGEEQAYVLCMQQKKDPDATQRMNAILEVTKNGRR
jgi:hypothetical protein